MITVSEVKTKRDIKDFIELPLRLYRNCEYFVPPFYSDERKLILSGGKTEIAESVFLLARRDGVAVGRIQGILHKQYNALKDERRVRFTRFDSIDDPEVAKALFDALEEWAKARKMTEICGPLGYNDLDREGLLIEGFSENSTYEEQYNYDYYASLIEAQGYQKEVDWLEFELRAPEKRNEMLARVAKRTLEINKLHIADTNMSKSKYVDKYADGFFDCLEECYSKLYGTVPISKEDQKEIIEQFKLIINPKFAVFICDQKERVVAFGLCFPSIGDALKKSGGRLTPMTLIRLLRQIKSTKTVDLGLVAVRPEYQNSGVNAVLINGIIEMLSDGTVERCETNLNLETNVQVISQWKYFSARQHKKRRSYIKKIETENEDA